MKTETACAFLDDLVDTDNRVGLERVEAFVGRDGKEDLDAAIAAFFDPVCMSDAELLAACLRVLPEGSVVSFVDFPGSIEGPDGWWYTTIGHGAWPYEADSSVAIDCASEREARETILLYRVAAGHWQEATTSSGSTDDGYNVGPDGILTRGDTVIGPVWLHLDVAPRCENHNGFHTENGDRVGCDNCLDTEIEIEGGDDLGLEIRVRIERVRAGRDPETGAVPVTRVPFECPGNEIGMPLS